MSLSLRAVLCAGAVVGLTGCVDPDDATRSCEYHRQQLESYEICLKTDGCILDGNDFARARQWVRIACKGQQ